MNNHPPAVNVADGEALARWQGEMHKLLGELHAAGMDSTFRLRVYSRKELRRRIARFHRRLGAMVDALHLPGQQPGGKWARKGVPGTPPEDGSDPDAT